MFSKLVYVLVPSLLCVGGIIIVSQSPLQGNDASAYLKYAKANLSTLSSNSITDSSANLPKPEIQLPKEELSAKELNEMSNSEAQPQNEELTFCGELIPVDRPNVAKKLEEEIQNQLKSKGSLIALLQSSHRYKAEIVKTLKANGLHEDFFYLAIAESGLANLTSPRGAKGFWQFMEETGRDYNLEVSETVDERLHPQKASVAACLYLKDVQKMFKTWTLSAAAYNAGAGTIQNAINNQASKDYFSLQLKSETARYVYRIVALKTILQNPAKYGLAVNVKNRMQPIPYFYVTVKEDIADLSAFAQQYNCNLQTLKLMNPWLISNHLNVKKGKSYEIRFPKREVNVHADEMVEMPYKKGADRKTLRDSIKFSWSVK